MQAEGYKQGLPNRIPMRKATLENLHLFGKSAAGREKISGGLKARRRSGDLPHKRGGLARFSIDPHLRQAVPQGIAGQSQ